MFADPANPNEMAYRQRTLAAIDAWWRAFQSKTTDLDALFSNRSSWDLPRWMADHLGAIHPRLMWEYGRAKRGPGHRLVITPEGSRWLRPVVRTVLERAPRIAGWEFYPYRLPEDVQHTIAVVEARVGVNITGALVEASIAQGRKVDVLYSFPNLPGIDVDTAHHAALVATETLLGEYALDTWIGAVGLSDPAAPSQTRPLPLERAQATVGSLIQSIQEQLPAVRTQDIDVGDQWANAQLSPEPADDYPGRQDLLVASTQHLELFEAAHSHYPFASACHSRVGEIFCYLKIDGEDVPREDFVEFRAVFEEALNPQMIQAGVGCCIGGGSGLQYAYIDLAITDINRAIPGIRQIMAQHRAPLRTWLLFFDDDLAQEWIGIYPQTPPPPMPSED